MQDDTLVFLDFETRSAVDLKKCGSAVYGQHRSTEIVCAVWVVVPASEGLAPPSWRGRPAHTWVIGDPPPVFPPNAVFVAHNRSFEMSVWERWCAGPCPPPERWRCTAAQAAAAGYPRGLELALASAGLPVQKDTEGAKLMLTMCRPRAYSVLGGKPIKSRVCDMQAYFDAGATPQWVDDAASLVRLVKYCEVDVRGSMELYYTLPCTPSAELELFHEDIRINRRGVTVDLDLVRSAYALYMAAVPEANAKIKELTGGVVNAFTENGRIVSWLQSIGVNTKTLRKQDVIDILEWLATPDGLSTLGGEARDKAADLLAIRQQYGLASVKKLPKILDTAAGGKLYETLIFHGAHTGRWAGSGVQLQNLPTRAPLPDGVTADGLISVLQAGAELPPGVSPAQAASAVVRSSVCAGPGKLLVGADLSGIEARVAAWLSEDDAALDVWRAKDRDGSADPYVVAACAIFGMAIAEMQALAVSNPAEYDRRRLIGKVAELALGYGGSTGAFISMALVYNVKLPAEQVDRIVAMWRRGRGKLANRAWNKELQIERLQHEWGIWEKLERAFKRAHAGYTTAVGRLTLYQATPRVVMPDNTVESTVGIRLPSGRSMLYRGVTLARNAKYAWAEDIKYNATAFGGAKVHTHGGKLFENACQAVSRDVFAESLMRVSKDPRFDLVLHIHDEAIAEVDENCDHAATRADFGAIVGKSPIWAPDLPVVAPKPWISRRLKK